MPKLKLSKVSNISFEFFPPKTEDGLQQLVNTAQELAQHNPTFFSVTFGAGGSTRDGTFDTVNSLQNKLNISVAPHLSCIGQTREELIKTLTQYKKLNIHRIVALRGDMPSGMVSGGEFKYAHELVKFLRTEMKEDLHIEVAAYPEFHPQAKNALYDVFNLKKKYEAGADSAITQYFFNPDAYFYFLDECAKQQIAMPIIPGIMPILNFTRLVRFSETCGAEIPMWLYKRLAAYGDDVESIQEFGIEVVSNLCQKLIAGGAPGLHFYTLNQAKVCNSVVSNLNADVVEVRDKRYAVW